MAGRESRSKARLPKQQLTVLAICRFAEPVAMTSVYPYIPEMIQSFDVPDDQVARWAGLMAAVFSLSQALVGIAWGRASDRFGRKPTIVVALTCTMVSSVWFGFSTSLPMAFVARSFQGLSNGNVGIIRTAVAELVPQRELQPRAFSVMPLVWNVGSIFGPSVGGSLVRPAERFPGLFGHAAVWKTYPFALPNLLISVLFLAGIAAGLLFLRESLEDKRGRRDYGLVVGSLLTSSCSRRKRPAWRVDAAGDEADPFLGGPDGHPSSPVTKPGPGRPPAPAGWSQVFNRQSNVNLAVYTFLAMHSVAFDQVLPIFMHYPVQSVDDPAVRLPLRFAGGFDLDSGRIGGLFTIYGISGMVVQFAVFPVVARRFGVLNCFKACALVFPLVYLATPFTALFATSARRQGFMLALMLVKGFGAIFAFPCSTILLTNSASSLKVLGTLNGVATSISAVGRAAGPALAGATFTAGVDRGYVITPWWTLAAIAVVGAVPAWWLVESEGFGGADGDSDGDDDDDSVLDVVDGDGRDDRRNLTGGGYDDGADGEGPLPVASSGAHDAGPPVGRTALTGPGGPPPDEPEGVPDDTASLSRAVTNSSTHSHGRGRRRRGESFSLRRMSSPVGMGPGVVPDGARRFSSDLGMTRSGFGTGGTSYH